MEGICDERFARPAAAADQFADRAAGRCPARARPHPESSLVVLGVAPPSGRVRFGLRYDLPDPPDAAHRPDRVRI